MKNILFVLSAIFLLASCKKSVNELPAATQTGANSFGLKLDGELWVPQKFAGINTPILQASYSGLGDLRIKAMNFASEPTETEFQIYVRNVSGPGVYRLDQTTDIYPNVSANYGYYVKRKINPVNEWITGPQNTGTVTITKLDLASRIVSGSFEFSAASIDGTADPIAVTEGRFDLTLQ